MSKIRPLEEHDLSAVASMFQRILRKSREPATETLQAYLKAVFLDAPDFDPELSSKVHVREDGRVSGFLGVVPLPMTFQGAPLRAAICGNFMVDAHEDDPFAGARLLREVLSGPQDLSFSETANDVATTMWRKANATVLARYSLEWLRVMRPAAFGVELVARRIGALRLLKPLAAPLDALAGRQLQRLSWARYLPQPGKADAFTDTQASDADIAALIPELLSPFSLRPNWSPQKLESMLVHARRKALYGERVQRIVRTRTGKPAGLFLYYGDAGRIGRVVQLMAVPGLETVVIERMLKNADERKMVAMRGRTQPALLDAMLGQRFAFVHAASTVLHSRRPDLLEAAATGGAFFNGFAGEGWTRLLGDRFD